MDPHNKNTLLNQRLSKIEIEFILIDHGLCPDWSRGEHKRRRDSMYLILEGEGKITIDGKDFFPKKNDLVLIPKNSIVSLYSENETCYNKYWCDFNARLDGQPLFSLLDFPYVVHLDDIRHAKRMFDRLDELHLRVDPAAALSINAAILELLATFLQSDTNAPHSSVKSNEFEKKVLEFIGARLGSHIAIKEISDSMQYNEKYFIDLFKKHFGTTPAKYIKALRMEKAKHDLLYTSCKMSDIIEKIGYPTVQMFSRDFQAHTGFSPTKFRKQFK